MIFQNPVINQLIDSWLAEDIGRGDLSSAALPTSRVEALWVAKQDGTFCGGELVKLVFNRLDNSIKVNLLIKEGETFISNQILLEIEGPSKSLIAAERTALNIAMHLSGIATQTSLFVSELKGTGVKLADTRKTTPGLRILEKYAVRCGGGINHRLGLDDTAMLKENHLAWAMSMKEAVKETRKVAPWPSKIIIEAETSDQATEAVINGADGILLDEFEPLVLHELVPKLRELAASRSNSGGNGQIILEASGVDPKDLKTYADTGIDLISSSAPITRSHWVDFSMRFKEAN